MTHDEFIAALEAELLEAMKKVTELENKIQAAKKYKAQVLSTVYAGNAQPVIKMEIDE